MTNNILFATAKNMVTDLNGLANVFNAENASANGLTVLYSTEMDDRKRARRAIYDITRMLRGEIKTGVTCNALPSEIATAVNGLKLNKQNTDFCTDKTNGDGVLTIDCNDFHAYMWRAAAPAEKTATTEKTDATDTATEKPAKKTAAKPTAATVKQYRCKNLPANRAALTNAMVLYTETGDFLAFETDAKTLKQTKIKTVK